MAAAPKAIITVTVAMRFIGFLLAFWGGEASECLSPRVQAELERKSGHDLEIFFNGNNRGGRRTSLLLSRRRQRRLERNPHQLAPRPNPRLLKQLLQGRLDGALGNPKLRGDLFVR